VERTDLIARLTQLIAGRRPPHPLRVAVDGPDAAGKTTLADELAAGLRGLRPVIRAGIDGFHRPRAERLRQGDLSPEGCFADSFDNDAVIVNLLAPLGADGDSRYRTAIFDHRGDQSVTMATRQAPPDAVLLFDGVFLLRTDLRPYWDLGIFLEIAPEETLRRALVRDRDLFGNTENTQLRYTVRYLPAQQRYRERARPTEAADIVIDHNDPANPVVLEWRIGPAAE
jgi:uridine kinase